MSRRKKDDWEKTRTAGVHLSADEVAKIEAGFKVGRGYREVARELKCASRTVSRHYEMLRTEGIDCPRPPRARLYSKPASEFSPTPAAERPSRFYKTTFEL
jgi:IS30 family transposase